MKTYIDSIVLKTSQLIGELDKLFVGKLHGWFPIQDFQLELIIQVNEKTLPSVVTIRPTSWPTGAWILCRFNLHNNAWRISEFTLRAPHIHNSQIGGINPITFRVTDMPGITVHPSNEIDNHAADIINLIILEKYPTAPSKFS